MHIYRHRQAGKQAATMLVVVGYIPWHSYGHLSRGGFRFSYESVNGARGKKDDGDRS